MVTLDGLVPKDHLLRKIERVIDFSFMLAGFFLLPALLLVCARASGRVVAA